MRFYTNTQKHYCGIDLHARTVFICIRDREGPRPTFTGADPTGRTRDVPLDKQGPDKC